MSQLTSNVHTLVNLGRTPPVPTLRPGGESLDGVHGAGPSAETPISSKFAQESGDIKWHGSRTPSLMRLPSYAGAALYPQDPRWGRQGWHGLSAVL
ncbi:MAG: hypothetical protein MZV70_54410 [Desulfobacterales bacterium]|nr:hypothetical protein [Desulfobacterales bacterium]